MAAATIRIQVDRPTNVVSRYLYGQFAEHLGRCVYGAMWVGEDSEIDNDHGIRLDTVAALKRLQLPVLRWPGGCFADNYHWIDGVGPRDKRPKRLNLWWRQPESNQFGTDEFMRLCDLIGTEPYLCVNVGSGTVEEARAWAEYCNCAQPSTLVQRRAENGHPEPHAVQFWGVGNEAWGCGGNLRPEFYADLFRRYATYVKETAGDNAKMIAVGSEPRFPEWDERFLDAMKGRQSLVDYIAVHVYSASGISDLEFTGEDYRKLVIDDIDRMVTHATRAIELAHAASTPAHRIGVIVDEWGTWYKEATTERGLYQQNTMQDALFTAVSFHRFHTLSPHLFMANMAQTANVLQALVLTKGPQLVLTPTYHVWEMFMPHRGAQCLPCETAGAPTIKSPTGKEASALSVSATRSAGADELFVSVVNLDDANDCAAGFEIADGASWSVREMRRLCAGDLRSHNTFDAPAAVAPTDVPLDPGNAPQRLTFPTQSITVLRFGSD